MIAEGSLFTECVLGYLHLLLLYTWRFLMEFVLGRFAGRLPTTQNLFSLERLRLCIFMSPMMDPVACSNGDPCLGGT